MPCVNPINVLVAFAAVAPKVVGVKGNEPALVPQATPVLERRPIAEKVAHPAVPPALDTIRLVVEAVPFTVRFAPLLRERLPFWSTIRAVVVAKPAVDVETAKRFVVPPAIPDTAS